MNTKGKTVAERISALVMAGVLATSMMAPAMAFADNQPSAGLQAGTGKTQLFTISKNSEFGGTAEPATIPNPDYDASDPDSPQTIANPYYNPVDENDAEGLGKNLKFTVPSALTFVIDDDNSLIAPTTAKVENKSDSTIHVSALKVEGSDDWNIVADATDTEAVADTRNAISLSIAPVTDVTTNPVTIGKAAGLSGFVGAKKSLARPDQWNIGAAGETNDAKTLSFAGNVANVDANVNAQQCFGEICWYMTTGEGTSEPNLNLGDGVTIDSSTAKVSLANGFYTISADSLVFVDGGANIEDGDEVTLTFGSDGEYHIDTVTVHDMTNDIDVDVTVDVVANTATFTMPNGEISISTKFAEGEYNFDWVKTSGVGWNDESSWEEIAYALDAHYTGKIDLTSTTDMGDNVWKVGDTKAVQLSAFDKPEDESICDKLSDNNKLNVREKTLHFVIADITNHTTYKMYDNNDVLTSKTPRFIVQQLEIGAVAQMYTTNTNTGYWASSRLRQHLQNDGIYYNALEDGFTNLLKKVKIPYMNHAKAILYSDDFLFLPTVSEGTGTSPSGSWEETSEWSYFDKSSNRELQYSLNTNLGFWWLRTVDSTTSSKFNSMYSTSRQALDASVYAGLAPAGCI